MHNDHECMVMGYVYHINILDWILLPLKLTIVQQKMHSCHGRHPDVICSHQSVM